MSGVPFLPLLLAFRRESRLLLAIDLPGHGRSDAPKSGMRASAMRTMTAEGLSALLPEPALLVGNSLGGVAALRFAIDRPGKTRAISLLSPGGAGVPWDSFSSFLQSFRLRTAKEARTFLEKIYFRPPLLSPLIARYALADFRRAPIQEFLRSISSGDLIRETELDSIQAPIQLIWGKADTLQPEDQRDFYVNALRARGAEIHEPLDFSHTPIFERREETARLLRAFFWRASPLEVPKPR